MNTPIKTNVGICVAVGAGLLLAAAAAWWHKRQEECPPKSWLKVGELSDVWCYPIKSCGQVSMTGSIDCVVLGVKQGSLRDRILMVTGLDNNFKTARTFPHMTQIQPSIDDNNVLTLKASGMENITVDLNTLKNKNKVQATVWDQPVPALDCGDDVAMWLSRFILKQDTGCRLVYYPMEISQRIVRPKNQFSKLTSKDTGAFPDASSYMIINEASVADLRAKLPEDTTCTPLHFRPNFVAKGAALKPYEEDHWQWVRIGEEAIFQCVKPCTRCIFTNIDPLSGIPNKKHEPLTTLKTYRQITDPLLRPFTGDSPVLGVHLSLHTEGKVKLGDPIYVSE